MVAGPSAWIAQRLHAAGMPCALLLLLLLVLFASEQVTTRFAAARSCQPIVLQAESTKTQAQVSTSVAFLCLLYCRDRTTCYLRACHCSRTSLARTQAMPMHLLLTHKHVLPYTAAYFQQLPLRHCQALFQSSHGVTAARSAAVCLALLLHALPARQLSQLVPTSAALVHWMCARARCCLLLLLLSRIPSGPLAAAHRSAMRCRRSCCCRGYPVLQRCVWCCCLLVAVAAAVDLWECGKG